MISICITSYNRDSITIRSFEQILNDDRVNEIIIVDDCSDIGFYTSLKFKVDRINNGKIKLYRNKVNLDCYLNKKKAVELATNDWCIILDSDNIIDKSYLDVLFNYEVDGKWCKDLIFQPEFAKPNFDFRTLSGMPIDRVNVCKFLNEYKNLETLLNAMNYFVNKHVYLSVFDDTIDPVTSDSLYQNYRLIKHGYIIFVTPGLQYEHPISGDSHYKLNNKRTPHGFHESIIQKLKELK